MPVNIGHPDALLDDRTLDYGCSDWMISSQKAAGLYNSGTKLWTKEVLENIEQQLSQSYTLYRFSVRPIAGDLVYVYNPLFQVQNSIWYVKMES
jgi:hypothetical protein